MLGQEFIIDSLFEQLLPCEFSKISECVDLFNLMQTNQCHKNAMYRKFLQIVEFKLSDVNGWKEQKFNLVHRIIIDNNDSFRQGINVLPMFLKQLTFGDVFNRQLPESDNCQLTKLSNLYHVTFGHKYNKTLNATKSLPPNLHILEFGHSYTKQLDTNSLPKNLTKLTFGTNFDQPIIPGILPETLRELSFAADSIFNQTLGKKTLPIFLTKLSFGKSFNRPFTSPDHLTHLVFGARFNQILEPGMLACSLTNLSFGYNLENLGLKCTTNDMNKIRFIGSDFNYPLDPGVLPGALTHLIFSDGSCFNKRLIAGSLPKTLTHVVFGRGYNHPFEKGLLPQTLIHFRRASRHQKYIS